jgi:hypothetical protein
MAENEVGAAEAEVGRYVYRLVEARMDATPGTPEFTELDYLSALVSDVEEYGADALSVDELRASPGSPKLAPTEPLRGHNGGFSTDATDPEMVKALARRVIRPLRERAKALGYAIGVHGSLERDIDLIAVPWTDTAHPPENLARGLRQVLSQLYPIGLEVPPSDAHPRPHGRVCWSWWIRPWTYIDLAIFPPTVRADDSQAKG